MNPVQFNQTITVPRLSEASSLQSPRESNGAYHQWKLISQVVQNVNKLNQNVTQNQRDIKKIGDRHKLGFDLYPFKIHTVPDIFRGGGNNWNTVRVRGGYVLANQVATSSIVNGTDMQQAYAYNNYYPVTNDGTTSSFDITLSTQQSQNPTWFWIENSGSVPANPNWWLRYGNNPTISSSGNPNPWNTYPVADPNHIPIGIVDCYTQASQGQALIQQFVDSDIVSAGGGSSTAWVEYDISSSYAAGTIVFVDPTKNYSISFIASSSQTYPPLCPGAYMTRAAIPSQNSGSIRNSFNYWYPYYPTIPDSASFSYSGSLCNYNYYGPISPMFLASMCVNRITTQYWMSGTQVSASFAYNMPFTGSH